MLFESRLATAPLSAVWLVLLLSAGCGTTVDYGDGVGAAEPTEQASSAGQNADAAPPRGTADPAAAASVPEPTEPPRPLFAASPAPNPSTERAAVAPEELFDPLPAAESMAAESSTPEAGEPEPKTVALAPWESAPSGMPASEPGDAGESADAGDDQFANLFADVLGGGDSQPKAEAALESADPSPPTPQPDATSALFGNEPPPDKPKRPSAAADVPVPAAPVPVKEPAVVSAVKDETLQPTTPVESEAAPLPWLAGASGDAEPAPAAGPEAPRVASLEATPRLDPPPVATPIDIDNTRHLAWLLGSKISLAGLSHVSPDQPVLGEPWQLTAIAELLNLEPPVDLAAATAGTTPARAISSVLAETRRLAGELAPKQGDDHAALVEVAVKSNALLLIYKENPALAEPIRQAVSAAALRAELPPETWRPLVALLEGSPTDAELRAEVFRLHESVERSLRR